MYALPLLALFPGFLSPSAIKEQGRGESSRFLFVLLKAREVWLCLHTSDCVCVCVLVCDVCVLACLKPLHPTQ